MCIQYAKQQKFKEIKLEVNKNSNKAIDLYKKFGFSNEQFSENYIEMKLIINYNN